MADGSDRHQTRKRPTLTPAWRRALVLHGRYLGEDPGPEAAAAGAGQEDQGR